MSVFHESHIEFDFAASVTATKHDTENRVWPGVDFLIEEIDG